MAGVFFTCKNMMTSAAEQGRLLNEFDSNDEGTKNLLLLLRDVVAREENLSPGILSSNIPLMQQRLQEWKDGFTQGWSSRYDTSIGPYYQKDFDNTDNAGLHCAIWKALCYGDDHIRAAIGAGKGGDVQGFHDSLKPMGRYVRIPEWLMESVFAIEKLDIPDRDKPR